VIEVEGRGGNKTAIKLLLQERKHKSKRKVGVCSRRSPAVRFPDKEQGVSVNHPGRQAPSGGLKGSPWHLIPWMGDKKLNNEKKRQKTD